MTTVVFCEDDAVIQHLIRAATRSTPYTVLIASNGAEGLVVIDAERPAAVFTDLGMPVLDGLQLIDRLRERAELRDMPIVVMSASGLQRADMDNLVERGVTDFLDKPFGPAELRAKLQQVLG